MKLFIKILVFATLFFSSADAGMFKNMIKAGTVYGGKKAWQYYKNTKKKKSKKTVLSERKSFQKQKIKNQEENKRKVAEWKNEHYYDKYSKRWKKKESYNKSYKQKYKSLSDDKLEELSKKLNSKNISKKEYKQIAWHKKMKKMREDAVDKFWNIERKKLLSGTKTTRNWTIQNKKDIIQGRSPKYIDSSGKKTSIDGHHKYNVKDHPQQAGDAKNIYPAERNTEHFKRWHGKNWQNETKGKPLLESIKELF